RRQLRSHRPGLVRTDHQQIPDRTVRHRARRDRRLVRHRDGRVGPDLCGDAGSVAPLHTRPLPAFLASEQALVNSHIPTGRRPRRSQTGNATPPKHHLTRDARTLTSTCYAPGLAVAIARLGRRRSAARRALSLTVAITYSNGIPDRWTRCRLGWSGSMLGEAPLRAVSNGTAGTG